MLVAFVESIKYVGHLLPVACLRIFVGYYYFNQALMSLQSDFLSRAYFAEDIRNFIPQSTAPDWYKGALETIVIPNWQVFAVSVTAIYLLIGFSYILGYLVRPISLLAVFLSVNLVFSLGSQHSEVLSPMVMALHLMLGWMGAGRCLGIDYYFYKRRRGIWW